MKTLLLTLSTVVLAAATTLAADVSETWKVDGDVYHLVFTGTLGEDGGMKGTIAVAGVEGTFTATKQ